MKTITIKIPNNKCKKDYILYGVEEVRWAYNDARKVHAEFEDVANKVDEPGTDSSLWDAVNAANELTDFFYYSGRKL